MYGGIASVVWSIPLNNDLNWVVSLASPPAPELVVELGVWDVRAVFNSGIERRAWSEAFM